MTIIIKIIAISKRIFTKKTKKEPKRYQKAITFCSEAKLVPSHHDRYYPYQYPHKKESPECSEDSKEAATYSPTCYCSTIGVNGLNFPFRNRKGELRCYNHLNLYCYPTTSYRLSDTFSKNFFCSIRFPCLKNRTLWI